MNCKQGDLAIVVFSICGNEGKIVRCLQRYDGPWREGHNKPGWLTDTLIKRQDGTAHHAALDKYLRPIRDQDGQDETLTWLDVPSKEIA